jgi:hypothetical protein
MVLYLTFAAALIGVMFFMARTSLSLWIRIPIVLFIVALELVLVASVFYPEVVLKGPGQEHFWQRTPLKEFLLFLVMCLGMAAKYLWDLIEIRRSRNANLSQGERKHGIAFDPWEFAQPLLISAIVFGTVLNVVEAINPSAFVFSFQNGFFWQTIFKKNAEPQSGRTVSTS